MSHLDPNAADVIGAIREIRDDNSQTDWAVFGFVPKSLRLKVDAKGEGTVEDFAYELSDGKIQFGYFRKVMSEVTKYVSVVWCGEGVMESVKGKIVIYAKDWEEYLKKNNFNYSANIMARNEDDLQESRVIDVLNKTSTFVRARGAKDQPTESLKDTRNKFWDKQQQEKSQFEEQQKQLYRQKEEELLESRRREEERLKEQNERVLNENNAFREQQAEDHRRQQEAIEERQRLEREKKTEEYFKTVEASRPPPVARTQERYVAPPPRRVEQSAEQPAEQPAYNEPAYSEPAYSEPAYNEPAYNEPVYNEQPAEQQYEQPYEQPAEQQYEQPMEQQYEQPAAAEEQVTYVKAEYDYAGEQEGDLPFRAGDIITLVDSSDPDGWWVGELNGVRGTFPSNFISYV